MISPELEIKAAKVRDTVEHGTRKQVDRLLSGLAKEHVTESEVSKALDYMVSIGKAYTSAEAALTATGTTEETIVARQGKK